MNGMDQMDDRLRQALRRVEPPEGFADRVRVRVDEDVSQKRPTFALARWAIAATLVMAVALGTWYRAEQQREVLRRAQGEEAKRQVLIGLRIAGSKLHAVEMKVNHREEQ